ncbi:MAG: lipid A biosynthesis lauroyl acyltransferase [Neisseriaceae bacterium]|nr:lipid A biosynthesis lauroyl acyltransferase [Neisseriaceae bacterium]
MRIAFFILYLISFLPMRVIHKIARVIGFLAYYLAKRRRKIGEINLALCFPEKTPQERTRILKQHFFHMAAMLLEFGVGWYSSDKRLYEQADYINKHYLDEAIASGRKVILLYPHFCALEMGVAKINQDVPLISIYSHQKNKTMDEQILKGRHRYNNVFLLGRTDGLLTIIRAIKKRDMVFLYLPDQDFGEKDSVFVPFFNIQTATTDGLSRIAKLTNALVVPVVPNRLPNGRFEVTFYPAWENFPSEDHIEDTKRMNAFIEDRIRELPEQYYWLHKRFKTRPNGEKSFY